jgi:hypothetical protein
VKVCSVCGPNVEAIREEERELEIELMMDAAVDGGIDPLRYACVQQRARLLAPASVLAHWAVARLIRRLQYGEAAYDRMPAKFRSS